MVAPLASYLTENQASPLVTTKVAEVVAELAALLEK